MANNISEVIDFLSVARDAYTRGFDGCKKDYDKELQEIKRDFNQNTTRYVEEKERAKIRFESNLEKLKTEARQFVTEHIEELRESELAKVQQIDTAALQKLSAVANLPLSVAELSALQSKYAPKNEYWQTRMIADLAEKNGLTPTQFLQTASLDTKLSLLGQLEGQLDKLLSEYDGTVKYDTLILLHDSILERAERIYNNGWALSSMEDAQVARRILLQLKGKNIAEQAIGLQNIMNNATPEVKMALFSEITSNAGVIDESALRWSGIADELASYQKNEHAAYTEAKKNIDKVITATSTEEVAEIADGLNENTYFQKMLTDASNRNIYVSDYLGITNVRAEAVQTE